MIKRPFVGRQRKKSSCGEVQRLVALKNNYCINLESCLLVIDITYFYAIYFYNINK